MTKPRSKAKSTPLELSDENQALFDHLKQYFDDKLKDQAALLEAKYLKKIEACEVTITNLTTQVDNLTKNLNECKQINDNLQQYTMRENVILSGSCIPPRTPTEDIGAVSIDLINRKCKLNININDLSTVHRLGRAPDGQPGKILMRFSRRSTKYRVIKAGIASKSNLYINEQLTKPRDNLFYKLRKFKVSNSNIITGLFVRDGTIFARDQSSTYHKIKCETDLQLFQSKLGINF